MEFNQLNSELIKIWNTFLLKDKSELHPVYFKPFQPSSITFVGMNPSFNKKGLNSVLKGSPFESINVDEYFRLSNKNFSIATSNEIDFLSKERYLKFFQHHHELTKDLGIQHWNHIDLFQYRQTKQKDFKTKVLNKDESLNAFGKAQFDLFVKALELTNPKIIILANATAGRILESNIKIDFSETIGTYVVEINKTPIPLFLSGMLTGGALDRYSRKRLFWHIKKVFNEECSASPLNQSNRP